MRLFQKSNLIGFDIGAYWIKIAQLYRNGDNKSINYTMVRNPCTDMYELNNESIDKLAYLLAKSCKKNNFKGKNVSLCISHPSVITRYMELPMMSHNQTLDNIAYELSQYFSIDIHNYKIDYRVMENLRNDNSDMQQLIAAAVPISIVQKYMTAIKKADLKLLYIDVAANAYLKILKLDTYPLCLIDFGFTGVDVYMYIDTKFYLCQNFNYEYLPDEMRRFFDYYRSSYGNIQEVICTGGGFNREGVSDYLKSILNIDPILIEPSMLTIKYDIGGRNVPLQLYLKAIAATLRGD